MSRPKPFRMLCGAVFAAVLPASAEAPIAAGSVRIDRVYVSVLESLPIQVSLRLVGRHPTSCIVETSISTPDRQRRIDVSLHAVAPGGAECAGPPTTLDLRVPIPLQGFSEGWYYVRLEGAGVAEFWYPTGSPPGRTAPPPAGGRSPDGSAGHGIDLDAFVAMAEQASCAAAVNMLYRIDASLVLWARAGRRCADNAYAVHLYDSTPDDLRCTHADGIAGPHTHCRDRTLDSLFRTVIAHVGEESLGLGDEHKVSLLWLGWVALPPAAP